MPTPALRGHDEEWSHDWDYSPVGYFGDPDDLDRGPHGVTVTIKANSDEEAERRVVAYAVNNFDDNFSGSVATSEGQVDRGVYRVRLAWREV